MYADVIAGLLDTLADFLPPQAMEQLMRLLGG